MFANGSVLVDASLHAHCFQAQVWKQDSNSLAVLNSTKEEQEANANALLISKAPEMLEMLKDAAQILRNGNTSNAKLEMAEKIEQLIKEATELSRN